MTKVCILDYGSGNVRSVYNAFSSFTNSIISNNIKDIRDSSHIVLPGVGSFNRAMKNINERIPLPELIEQIRLGKMFLGICVGMQVLGSVGYEFEKTNGLSLIEGEIVSMQSDDLALPHVGWNSVKQVHSHDLFRDIPNDSDFYFVHSYKFQEKFERNLLGLTEYGKDFVSVIAEQNILGVQFHPEKSQTHGLKLLRNFVDIK